MFAHLADRIRIDDQERVTSNLANLRVSAFKQPNQRRHGWLGSPTQALQDLGSMNLNLLSGSSSAFVNAGTTKPGSDRIRARDEVA